MAPSVVSPRTPARSAAGAAERAGPRARVRVTEAVTPPEGRRPELGYFCRGRAGKFSNCAEETAVKGIGNGI